MLAKLNYAWRLFATGLCFVTFSLGGLLLGSVVLPMLFLLPAQRRHLRARQIISLAFRGFLAMMQITGVLKLEVLGSERLQSNSGTLVLANHPTLIDVVALLAYMPNANCVVKQALWNSFFLGGVVRAAGYISNEEPEALIAQCAEDIAQGNPLIIFPEGTRSVPGKALKFRRGAAYIAMQSQLPITPVIIRCYPATLTKGEKWYKIPPQRAFLQIQVMESISITQWAEGNDASALTARQLTSSLEHYFTETLHTYGSTTSGDQATHHQVA